MRRMRWAGVTAAAGAAAVAVVLIASGALAAGGADGTGERELAPIVAAWPDAYTVTGTKSEPLYTERIAATRDGDRFALRIEAISQGDAALGVQRSAVAVGADGSVAWTGGCTKTAAACSDDPALRGFLASAALASLAARDRLPETGTVRTLHGTPVVCVDDAALHPDAAPAAVPLDPCFSVATGAVLGHWSADSAAFVGPTLAPGFREHPEPDAALLAEATP
jgi:hypothetical protein